MKLILFFLAIILVPSVHSQMAKSFYYDGNNPSKSGTYVAKHPTQNSYYTAIEKLKSGHAITSLVSLDKNGNTLWYSSTPHFGSTINFNSIGGILVTDVNIFVSVYVFPSFPTATLNIYKYDHSGTLLDSTIISTGAGLVGCKGDMVFDADGNICTVLKGSNNVFQFCKINPTNMDLLNMVPIGYSSYTNLSIERAMFVTISGTNTVVTYNTADTIKFITINQAANIVSTNFILSPFGDATDIYTDGTNYAILINKEFGTSFTNLDNPLRIIQTDNSFNVLTNTVYPVFKAVVFSSISIDSNGDIYVASKNSSVNGFGGSVLKISSGALVYEHSLEQSNFNDVIIENNKIVLAGQQNDFTNDCQINTKGNVFAIYSKSTTPNFETVSPHMTIQSNNLTAAISYSSDNLGSSFPSGFGFASVNGGSTIYRSALLIAGTDINSNLKTACNNFNNVFAAGPITNANDYNQTERDRWERVWKINKSQIDQHIQAYLSGDVNYVTPEVILHWPGNGNVAKGQSAQLARYKDLNNNQIYEPLLGEYPLIIGDYCVLSIYNDVNADTSEMCIPMNERINTEIYEYVYGFECGQDSSIQNSLFVHYEIINKSAASLYNTHVGNFMDYDIGISSNDYASSDVMRGMYYGRNSIIGGPEQGYIILGSKADEDGVDNAFGIGPQQSVNGCGYGDGIADNERLGMTNFTYFNNSGSINGNPSAPIMYYNLMQSMWLDGSPVLHGGDGVSFGTTSLPSKFAFQGDSDPMWYSTGGVDPGFHWTEEQAGNPPGDRRGIASSGPFTLAANDTVLFDVVYLTGMESISGGYTSNEALLAYADSARHFYKVNATPCGQNFDYYEPFDGIYPYLVIDEKIELINPILFPNPTTGFVTITGLPDNSTIFMFKLDGALISQDVLNNNKVSYDYSDLPSGIYFIKVESENYSGTLKFVKQ